MMSGTPAKMMNCHTKGTIAKGMDTDILFVNSDSLDIEKVFIGDEIQCFGN